MTIDHPRRLRAEAALPQGLRDALRELPNAPPGPAQLAELRQKLGLPVTARRAASNSALIPDRRLRERRLRRAVVALVFFPIAATAAVGAVIDQRERSARSEAAVARQTEAFASRGAHRSALSTQPPLAVPPEVAPSTSPDPLALPAVLDSATGVARRPRATPATLSDHSEPSPPAAELQAVSTEVELLQRANAALKGNPAQALALANEHRQRFPTGNLAQEREVIAIKALLGLGDPARARANLTRFERAYPHSAYVLELQQMVH